MFVLVPAAVVATLFMLVRNVQTRSFPNPYISYKKLAVTGELTGGVTVRQTFTPDFDTLSAVELLVATYMRGNNEGELLIEIIDEESGNSYGVVKEDVSAFDDNSYRKIQLPEIRGVNGRTLALVIKSTSPEDKGATLYVHPFDKRTGELTVNGKRVDGALVLKLYKTISIFEFLDRVTQFKPEFIKGRLFYAAVFLYFYGMAFWLVYYLKKLSGGLPARQLL